MDNENDIFPTTIYMTYKQRAQFDEIRAARSYVEPTANKRTRRPSLRDLLSEAVSAYLVREMSTICVKKND